MRINIISCFRSLVAGVAACTPDPMAWYAPEPNPAAWCTPEPVAAIPKPSPAAPEQTIVDPESTAPVDEPVVLTRPKWVPKYTPTIPTETTPEPVAEPVAEAPLEHLPPAEPEEEGFTLRFASDAALTRAVAAHHVGLYAIETGRAKRMTVSESRISFWDASVPNSFHEMETSTVPVAVIRALARTGVATDAVSWGVTLPGRMKSQLDTLMHEHRGGSLIISAGGDIHWEAS